LIVKVQFILAENFLPERGKLKACRVLHLPDKVFEEFSLFVDFQQIGILAVRLV
jgi:hypothetical protein